MSKLLLEEKNILIPFIKPLFQLFNAILSFALTFGDGGKYLCITSKIMREISQRKCMVWSFGSANDISFDTHMSRLFGCSSRAFDPTVSIESLESKIEGDVVFHNEGLGPSAKDRSWTMNGNKLKSLGQFAEDTGDTVVDFLKIDIELSETPAFSYMFNNERSILSDLKVKVIMLEYHSMSSKNIHRKSRLLPFLRIFYELGYYMYFMEHNIYYGENVEYGFVHKDYL